MAVRLTLINTGAVPLVVTGVPPWRDVRLIVTGADGRPIATVRPVDRRHFISGRPVTLEPQQAVVETYDQQWLGLQHWGYGPFPPGRYTLTAVPTVQGPDVNADTETVRSNQVTITVAP